MTMWDSIDGLTRVQNWLQFTVVVAAIFTTALAVVGYVTKQRLDTLKSARDTAQQARLDSAEGAARDAQERATALARQQQPRQLAAAEAELFQQALASMPKGDVVIAAAMADAESEQFALQIYNLFLAAGWTPKGVNLAMWSPIPSGVFVTVSDAKSPPAHAGPVQAALDRVGIHAPGAVDQTLAAGTIGIRVGVKPR